MKVWVDADACPVVIRDILIKAALNRKVEMEFVANHFYQLPNSPYLNWRRVPQGPPLHRQMTSQGRSV